MATRGLVSKIKNRIETILPMTIGSFFLLLLVGYFLYIVGRTTWNNYQSNKVISAEREKIAALQEEIKYMQYQVNYYKTNSFREKEAREKLGYKAAGERVISLPLDKPEDKIIDTAAGEVKIKTLNYRLWWQYFFGSR